MKLTRCAALFVVLGCAVCAAPPPSLFELHKVAKSPGAGVKEYTQTRRDGSAETVLLDTAVLLDGTALTSAEAVPSRNGFQVLVTLTKAGGKLFGEITTKSVGERIGIVVAGRLLSAPEVHEPIPGGTIAIGGTFTEKEATDLAAELKRGIER